jgi:hypothetical protein
LQEKFRPAIHEYAKVIATTQKILKAGVSINSANTVEGAQLTH